MRRNLKYLRDILIHKWYVFLAMIQLDGSIFAAIMHDMSKFRPSEWGPYLKTFYDEAGESQYYEHEDFKMAWMKHQHRNSHHWQHYILRQDDGELIVLEMPRHCVTEMICDWIGAGRAITGENNLREWYLDNEDRILLHPSTRSLVSYYVYDLADAVKI